MFRGAVLQTDGLIILAQIRDVVYHPPVVKALPPGLPHSRPLEPLQSPSAVNLQDSQVDEYRRAAAQYGDDPHTQSHADGPQMARPLRDERAQSYVPTRSEGPTTPLQSQGGFGHGHVMFTMPDSPGYAQASPYGQSSYAPAISALAAETPGETQEHNYEYEQAREMATLEAEREQQQAYTDAQEKDDVYAADATILPAKHVYPVHAVPAVTNLNEQPAQPSDELRSSASNPLVAPEYTRERPPPHNLVERGSTRTLTVGDWTIRTVKRPILNGKEIDA